MRYRFYHDWLYQIANILSGYHIKLSKYHIKWSHRYLVIMKRMTDRLEASIGED